MKQITKVSCCNLALAARLILVLGVSMLASEAIFAQTTDSKPLQDPSPVLPDHPPSPAVGLYPVDSTTTATLSLADAYLSESAILSTSGKHLESLELALKALTIQGRPESDGLTLSETYCSLGECLRTIGETQLAVEACQEAVRLARDSLDTGNEDAQHALFKALNSLGDSLIHNRSYKEARQSYQEALGIAKDLFKSDPKRIVGSLNNLILVSEFLGDSEDLELLYHQVLVTQRSYLPRDHPDLARSLVHLADTHQEQKNFRLSEREYLETLPVFKESYGGNDAMTAHALRGLSSIYAEMNREDEQLATEERLEKVSAVLRSKASRLSARSSLEDHEGTTLVFIQSWDSHYHRPDCSMLFSTEFQTPLKEAIEGGFERCLRCKPPRSERSRR